MKQMKLRTTNKIKTRKMSNLSRCKNQKVANISLKLHRANFQKSSKLYHNHYQRLTSKWEIKVGQVHNSVWNSLLSKWRVANFLKHLKMFATSKQFCYTHNLSKSSSEALLQSRSRYRNTQLKGKALIQIYYTLRKTIKELGNQSHRVAFKSKTMRL